MQFIYRYFLSFFAVGRLGEKERGLFIGFVIIYFCCISDLRELVAVVTEESYLA